MYFLPPFKQHRIKCIMTKRNGEKKILFWAKYGSKTNNKTEGMENLLEIYTNNSMQRRNTVQ